MSISKILACANYPDPHIAHEQQQISSYSLFQKMSHFFNPWYSRPYWFWLSN